MSGKINLIGVRGMWKYVGWTIVILMIGTGEFFCFQHIKNLMKVEKYSTCKNECRFLAEQKFIGSLGELNECYFTCKKASENL